MIKSPELARFALSLDLASWPSVAYADRITTLPRDSGFYCLWQANTALYIGESQSIHGRWYGGHKHRHVASQTQLRYFLYDGTRLERQFIEWMLIIIHQPSLNSYRNIRQLWYDALIEVGWQPLESSKSR